ncbi:MAG: hypothetical protein F4226_03480 [Synechococcus sp. SB0678_bin_12]|nr:hypothetical protein [Synechococcus sp. SB0678_bin_12]MYI88146.1 hypothetical protein [Synechococcus sp. SB0672_bin_10]
MLPPATGNSSLQQSGPTYGLPTLAERLTLTPGLAVALSPAGKTYSLLWAVAPHADPARQRQTAPWEISLEGEREESSTTDSSVEHSLGLRFSILF